jgi:hypothetical protein
MAGLSNIIGTTTKLIASIVIISGITQNIISILEIL